MKPSTETRLVALTEARLSGRLSRGQDDRVYSLGDSTPITNVEAVADLARRGWLDTCVNGWRITSRGLTAERRLLRRRNMAA